jgi:superoxide dismutase, Cu-Zn family
VTLLTVTYPMLRSIQIHRFSLFSEVGRSHPEDEKMKIKYIIICLILVAAAVIAIAAAGSTTVIDMQYVTDQGTGKKIGTITAEQKPYGTLFTPKLSGLSPGLHGFHVHAGDSCGPKEKDGRMVPGLAAGGHFDPEGTGSHQGPYGKGHMGDLPALYADKAGQVTLPVLAPRIRVKDLKGHALIIHAAGDNYSDDPKPLGGGGARIACGMAGK